MTKFRKYRTDSVEGEFCMQMAEGLRSYLDKKLKSGKIPPELVDALEELQGDE